MIDHQGIVPGNHIALVRTDASSQAGLQAVVNHVR